MTEPAPSPLPVTLVAGFLGAGKTTLIRQLLAAPHGLRIGLILNELGEAGFDGVPTVDTAFLELAGGCACCVRNPDLVAALEELSARGDLDRVIVEPSGLADPLPIAWSVEKPELAGKVRLDAVIVAVDAVNAGKAAPEEWEAQVRCADVVVLTKRDLADSQQIRDVEARVRALNPKVRFASPGDGLPVDVLLDAPLARSLDGVHAPHSAFRAATFASGHDYDLTRLEDLLEALPDSVFRAKGLVRRAGGGWASFHVVAGRVDVEPDVPAPPHGESRLAFFGPGLDERLLADAVHACEAA